MPLALRLWVLVCAAALAGATAGAEPAPAPNDLPAPNHPILFGYYYADGRYGDRTAEVFPYTNLYCAWSTGYANPLEPGWEPQLKKSLQNAFDQKKNIYLGVGHNIVPDDQLLARWGVMLDIAAPFWSKVALLELVDEPGWDQARTETRFKDFKNLVKKKGLPLRPVGSLYTRDDTLKSDAWFAPSVDWVGIEAYIDGPKQNDPTIVKQLEANLDAAKARVPKGKSIVLIMMSYDRNGGWKNIESLRTMQEPVYRKACNDPRVIAITMFSYARTGGARDHPELAAHHRRIAEKLGIVSGAGATAGRDSPSQSGQAPSAEAPSKAAPPAGPAIPKDPAPGASPPPVDAPKDEK